MSDKKPPHFVPEDTLRLRLAHFDETRAFHLKMWTQNPHLARQAGARIQAMLRPLPDPADA